MKDLQLLRAFRLLWQTLPFIAIRSAVYFGCSVVALVSMIGCTVAGYAINSEVGGFFGFVAGLIGGLAAFIDRLLKVSLGFVDEVIVALSYRTRSTNPWHTASKG